MSEAPYLYLTTIGRRSGQQREIEIWFTERADGYYIIAEHGTRAQWVLNILANPKVRFRVGERAFAGTARVLIDAEHGGRIASLSVAGMELLVNAGASALDWGCYPMAPFAGRIRNGRFSFKGTEHQLPRNAAPHAIHGTVFERPWEVDDLEPIERKIFEIHPILAVFVAIQVERSCFRNLGVRDAVYVAQKCNPGGSQRVATRLGLGDKQARSRIRLQRARASRTA